MASPFVRTVRSIQADNFTTSLLELFTAIVLLSVWIGWFTLARITLSETGQISQHQDATVSSEFPLKAQGRIKRGQKASLQLAGEAGPVEAVVTEVSAPTKAGKLPVKLFAFWNRSQTILAKKTLTGSVTIETDHVSPLTFVLRGAAKTTVNGSGVKPNP
jgi:hypothetical protein